jgi:hypothetical protein
MVKFIKKYKKAMFIMFILFLLITFVCMSVTYHNNSKFYSNGLSDFFRDLNMIRNASITYSVPDENNKLNNYGYKDVELSYVEKLYMYNFSDGLNGAFIELRNIPWKSWTKIRLRKHYYFEIRFGSDLISPIPVVYDYTECENGLLSTVPLVDIITTYDFDKKKTMMNFSFEDYFSNFQLAIHNYYDDTKFVGYGCKTKYTLVRPNYKFEYFVPEVFKYSELYNSELKQIPKINNSEYFIMQNWH